MTTTPDVGMNPGGLKDCTVVQGLNPGGLKDWTVIRGLNPNIQQSIINNKGANYARLSRTQK